MGHLVRNHHKLVKLVLQCLDDQWKVHRTSACQTLSSSKLFLACACMLQHLHWPWHIVVLASSVLQVLLY